MNSQVDLGCRERASDAQILVLPQMRGMREWALLISS